MKIKVERKWPKGTYTIGRFYIDGIFYCNTLEDTDRGLHQSQGAEYVRKRKIAGETAIPKGTYGVSMNTTSPKYSASSWYWNLCRGKVPRLLAVPGFDGVLVGKNTKVGRLTDSRTCFQEIYKLMKAAADDGEEITIEIC